MFNNNKLNNKIDSDHYTEADIKPSNDESFQGSGEQLSPSQLRGSNPDAQTTAHNTSPAQSRKRGGPRTPQGKRKSSRNALKHGIFSTTALLEGESKSEYDTLLKSLVDHFAPEDAPEAFLVSILAYNLWRRRRISVAEQAENRRVTEFLEWDERRRQDVEAANLLDLQIRQHGLMQKIENPKILKACLDQLKLLKGRIRGVGFDEEGDKSILITLYGAVCPVTGEKTLVHAYIYCLNADPRPPTVGVQEEAFGPEDRKAVFLKFVEDEIQRLERYGKEHSQIECKRISVEKLRGNIPHGPQLERFLKYEAHLDRNFDRTLNHLERLQRIRKGAPSAPTVNVNLVQ